MSFDAHASWDNLDTAQTMETRRFLLAGRFAAVLGVLAMRGGLRAAAWAAHDFLWLYPTLRRNCPWHGEVLTHFHTAERSAWLTIDDGPEPESTPRILDLLAHLGRGLGIPQRAKALAPMLPIVPTSFSSLERKRSDFLRSAAESSPRGTRSKTTPIPTPPGFGG